MCRLKTNAEKLWNRAQSLISRKKGECSKLIFQILVYYYYYKLFYTGISWFCFANHFQEASNELDSKQMVFKL